MDVLQGISLPCLCLADIDMDIGVFREKKDGEMWKMLAGES